MCSVGLSVGVWVRVSWLRLRTGRAERETSCRAAAREGRTDREGTMDGGAHDGLPGEGRGGGKAKKGPGDGLGGADWPKCPPA